MLTLNLVNGWRRHRLLWVMSAALLLLGAVRLTHGVQRLILGDTGPDLYSRWREMRYLYNGQNPNDLGEVAAAEYFSRPLRESDYEILHYAAAKYSRPLPESSRDRRIDPDIGPLYFWEGTYPGWSYFTAAAFVLPTNWRFTRIYFCFLDALALAVTAVWAYRLGRPHSVAGGIFLAASALALLGNYKALERGQYGLIVNGLLIGVYILMEKHKPMAAGFLYGLAAIKPHIFALFAIVFLVRKQWKLLAVTVGYIAFASLCVWALSKTNPLEMLKQSIDAGMTRGNDGGSFSFLKVLMRLNVDRKVAATLATVLGLISTVVLAWIWRNGTTLALFAMAATIGRLWTYHHSYDNVMLVFLIVALGEAFLMRYSNWMAFAFFLVGISLWTPDRFVPGGYSLPGQIAFMISWLVGLAILLAWDPRSCQPSRQE